MLRIFRLIKILKLIKSNRGVVRQFSEKMRISSGQERLAFFSFFFLIFLHVSSCMFVMLAHYEEGFMAERWIEPFLAADNMFELYVTSCYFVLTTTATVGYGDIYPMNTLERLFCMGLMMIGVLSFTFISGALSSILQTYDFRQAAL